jgi:hypothetical protein
LPESRDEIVFEYKGVAWAINKMGYFRYIKVNDQYEMHPEDVPYKGYYAHMTEQLPIVVAGGEWNNQGWYDSYLNAAKPIADKYLVGESSSVLVDKEASHPFIIAASEDCPDCSGGRVQYCTGCNHDSSNCNCTYDGSVNPHLTLRDCNTCGGNGEISRNPGQWQIVPYDQMDRDTIKLINPDVSINKYHAGNNAEIFKSFMRALHLDYIDQAQSKIAKDKDMETRYQFFMTVSDDEYDRVLPSLCNIITSLRNVTSVNGQVKPEAKRVLIVKPTQFQLKTERDLLDDFEVARKAGLPEHILKAQSKDYVDKLYGGDEVLKKKDDIISELDIFAVTSMADIQIALINGIDHRKLQFHLEIDGIIRGLIRDKGTEWFINSKFEVVKAEIDKAFDKMAPPVVPMQQNIVRDNINI